MPHPSRPSWLLLGALGLASAIASRASAPPTSTWVTPGTDGRLIYKADTQGNAIPDFSRAGYGGGGVRLPQVPAVVTLSPQPSGDDGARIQAALDEVGRKPADARGFRGAVLLRRGLYRIEGAIAMRAGGVVLRGEGMGEKDTVILGAGKKQRTLIEVGEARSSRREIEGTRRAVTDRYVPWSAKSFSIESTDGLKPGDRIVLHRPSTTEWIHELGMDRITNRPGAKEGSTVQWKAGGFDLSFERTIVAIEGKRLTLDAPVMNALDARFGGGAIHRYTYPRIAECGVENLRLVSEYEKGRETEDEAHAWVGINLGAVENAWVRDVTVQHFSHAVQVGGGAIFTTIQDCMHVDPVSIITGSRRYSFSLNGQYGLVQRCNARDARHAFVTSSRVAGPNVFLDGKSVQSHSDSGPHHRWAVGSLYDNIGDDRELNVQDRQWAGSGHGWAGAQQVFWNCEGKEVTVQQPPTAQNYAIGTIGKFAPGQWSPKAPDGVIEASGVHVTPRSLYQAQLAERLGPGAVANIAK
ncbi:MAG TPA: hypothetical protein VM029_16635 [Opitutaceae bacterium]|nr:hypothetical protein [Opitutaceae bacterium]